MADADRSTIARIAAYERWAREDPTENARRAQAGLWAKFLREVIEHDPDVTEPELSRRAEARRRAHMIRLAKLSHQARRANRAKQ